MRKLVSIAAAAFISMMLYAEDYVYLRQEPTLTVSYPGNSDATDLLLSGRASGMCQAETEVWFSGVSREESNTSGLDASKPIGMYMILR